MRGLPILLAALLAASSYAGDAPDDPARAIAEKLKQRYPATRIDQFVQIQDDIMAQAPSVPLYQPKVNSMHTEDVGNFFLHPVWIFDYPAYYFTTPQK